MDKCSKSTVEKTKKGQADTGPVRNPSTAKRTAKIGGGKSKSGGIFGRWQKNRKA
jgi:hypothetical protein